MEFSTTTLGLELDVRLADLWRQSRRHGDLSRTAVATLATLRDGGPLRITELAATEAVAQPTMTATVDRLERDGLVTRTTDPGDARAVLVALTDGGRARLERMREARAGALERRLDALDPEERAVLAAALPVLDKLTGDPS
jgi:DNA-binding MarR family transcriptional regulator